MVGVVRFGTPNLDSATLRFSGPQVARHGHSGSNYHYGKVTDLIDVPTFAAVSSSRLGSCRLLPQSQGTNWSSADFCRCIELLIRSLPTFAGVADPSIQRHHGILLPTEVFCSSDVRSAAFTAIVWFSAYLTDKDDRNSMKERFNSHHERVLFTAPCCKY